MSASSNQEKPKFTHHQTLQIWMNSHVFHKHSSFTL
jgi:hypothetical protein